MANKTRKVSKSRARSYRRRGKASPCRGKGPAVCRSLNSCKYSRGKKRTFCRRSSNSSRKNRSLAKKTRTGRKYGGSRMGGSRRRRAGSRRGGSRMGGSRRRRAGSRRGGSRRGGSRRRRAGSRRGGSRRGGSRRRRAGSRRGGSRKRRAGTFGILEQAIVPGSLLLANTYYKGKKGGRRSRRSRKNHH
tara:strand:- start:3884 stop:4450 length:567 start_codon:yes stop_codon:yes gene_type:complete